MSYFLGGITDGHAFEYIAGDCERQGSLACCSPWGLKELDTTEQLNNNFVLWSLCFLAVEEENLYQMNRKNKALFFTFHHWISGEV